MNTPNTRDRQAVPVPGGFREVLGVGLPLVISMGSFTLMQFCDRLFLAWHNPVSIQAALPAGVLSFTLICGFMELAGYANTFVAQYFGSGDHRRCARATVQGLILALLSWPLIIALIPFGRWAILRSGHPPETIEQELIYFTILMIGGVIHPLSTAMSSFFTGRGRTRTTMTANIVGNAVNIVLDYALIFGKFGFPELGIKGAAIATVVSGIVSPTILLVQFLSRKHHAEFGTRTAFRADRALLLRILRFGTPSSLHLVVDVSAFSFFVMLVGRLGAESLTVNNLAFSINTITFMPLLGLGIAAATVVGQYQGKGDSDTAQKAGFTTWKIGFVYMSAVGLTFLLFPAFYLSLFTRWSDGALVLEDILPLGTACLALMALWGVFDCANLTLAGALKGAGDTRFVMLYSMLMSWGVWIPGHLYLLFVREAGLLALWMWATVYVAVFSIGYLLRFASGRWKSIKVIELHTPIQPMAPGADGLMLE